MKPLLFIICNIIFAVSFAQNWLPFDTAKTYNYIIEDAVYIEKEISTTQNGDTSFFKTIVDLCQDCTADTLLSNQADIFGFYFLNHSDSSYTFYSKDTFVLKPLKSLGQTWIFNNILTAEVVEVSLSTFGTQNDSIKKIWLGNLDTLIISKNHGIIEFPDFHKDTTFIQTGIEGLYGFQNLSFWDVYNFEVGDIFQYEHSSGNISLSSNFLDEYKIEILNKEIDPIGFTYFIKKSKRRTTWHLNASNIQIPNYTYSITNDTLSFKNDSATIFNKNLGEWFEIQDGPFTPILISSFYNLDNQNILTKVYDLPTYLGNISSSVGYLVKSANNYCEIKGFERRIEFKSGLGMVLDQGIYFESGETLQLIGYKKGNNLVDTIYNDEFYVTSIKNNPLHNYLSFRPNPANSQLIIDLNTNQSLNLRLVNLLGQEVYSREISNNEVIDISTFAKGVYILSVKDKYGKNAFSKLLIE